MARSWAPSQLIVFWGGGGEAEGRRQTTSFLSHLCNAKLKHKAKGATFTGMLEVWEVNFVKTKILDTK